MSKKINVITIIISLLLGLEMVFGSTLLYEDFEATTFPPTNWTTVTSGTCVAWVRRTSGLIFGAGSGGVRIFAPQSGGNITGTSYLRTPSMNFSSAGIESLSFYFRCPGLGDAYGIVSSLDTIKIEASTNGTNWTTVKVMDSNYVFNLPNQIAVRDSGCKQTINLGAYNGQTTVYIRWILYDNFTEGATGTNRYFNIDSAYVYDVAAGIEENTLLDANRVTLKITPNPFTTNAHIQFNVLPQNLKNIKIYDATGNLVRILTDINTNTIVWDGNDKTGNIVAPGVYFVKLETNKNERQVVKILLTR